MKLTILFFLLIGYGAMAQNLQERYRQADEFRQKYRAGYFYGNIQPQWIEGTSVCWYAVKTPEGVRYVLADAIKRTKKPAFDATMLAKVLEKETGKKVDAGQLPIHNLRFSKDLKTLTFQMADTVYTYQPARKRISEKKPAPPRRPQGHWGGVDRENHGGSTLSPDRQQEAYIREGNLYVKNLTDGKVRQLSRDGSPGEYYSSYISWSPDSRKLVCCKYRPAWVRQVRTIVSSPAYQLQPTEEVRDYVKPGDALPIKQPVLFTLDEGKQIPIRFAEPENQFSVGNIQWSDDSRSFTFDYNKRGHQQYIIYKVNGEDPQAQVLIKEEMPTFIYYNVLYRKELKSSGELLWISERDGWRHLYLYDAQTGAVKRQLTRGEWVVKRVLHVDETARIIYLVGCGKDAGEDPYLEKIYRLDIDSGNLLCLTPENGQHEVVFSADYAYFTDSWSRMDCPHTAVLRSSRDGSILLPLEKADMSRMLADGWQMPEVFTAKGRDGKTDIWGVIIRPTNFDPSRKYPVIEYIYAGPHDSFVPKTFFPGSWVDNGLAELGFIVVQIDGMGTFNRSKAFHDVCWKNLKDGGFPDRIAWMRAAAAVHPEMDLERVGIFGCSAGGQSAMGALLFHPDFYKVGVSACGCHDNRMDKIWWNEQWMGYPVGKEYEECSNAVNAWRLQGKLMLMLGELDDNVDPSSTLQVVNELVKANKDFEFVMLPNQRHTMGENYGERKRRDFFVRHLLGEDTPDWNSLKK